MKWSSAPLFMRGACTVKWLCWNQASPWSPIQGFVFSGHIWISMLRHDHPSSTAWRHTPTHTSYIPSPRAHGPPAALRNTHQSAVEGCTSFTPRQRTWTGALNRKVRFHLRWGEFKPANCFKVTEGKISCLLQIWWKPKRREWSFWRGRSHLGLWGWDF